MQCLTVQLFYSLVTDTPERWFPLVLIFDGSFHLCLIVNDVHIYLS